MPNVEFYFVLEDNKGDKSKMTIPAILDDLGDIQVAIEEMGALIDALVIGGFVSAGVTIVGDVSGLNTAAAATSDVQEGARFVFATDDPYLKSVRLPTFDEAFIISGSKNVDTTDADVAAFVTMMTTGMSLVGAGGTGSVAPTDYCFVDLTTLKSAKEDWGRNR